MCIRDSPNTGRQRPARSALTGEANATVGNPLEVPPSGNHICLLYTSDAADDLLCVDLGGRRIIKKKNNHNNTRQSMYEPH